MFQRALDISGRIIFKKTVSLNLDTIYAITVGSCATCSTISFTESEYAIILCLITYIKLILELDVLYRVIVCTPLLLKLYVTIIYNMGYQIFEIIINDN